MESPLQPALMAGPDQSPSSPIAHRWRDILAVVEGLPISGLTGLLPSALTKEAERALEEACLTPLGTFRLSGPTLVVRSDNGLIYQSRRFRATCRDYRCASIHHELHAQADTQAERLRFTLHLLATVGDEVSRQDSA
jgi:hypothetical protein